MLLVPFWNKGCFEVFPCSVPVGNLKPYAQPVLQAHFEGLQQGPLEPNT